MDDGVWDVVVVGAGPGGSMAALAAAEAGARTLLIERALLPRDKLCGGGLIGVSLDALPAGFTVPARDSSMTAVFTRACGDPRERSAAAPFLTMVNRAEFDAELVAWAVRAGAQLAQGVRVDDVVERDDMAERDDLAGRDDVVELRTSAGRVRARAVVGADGSASRIARHVGAEYGQVDLGLEVQVDADASTATRYRGRVVLDFGGPPGAYAWVFPKGDRLTVGAIAARGLAEEERGYLRAFVRAQGLDHLPASPVEGHLTRCRTPDSPLGAGRVLLAGDAAGLLEPWTREGISYALRSGRLAGGAAAALAVGAMTPEEALAGYTGAVAGSMGADMAVGAAALAAYTRHPGAFHAALGRSGRGWRAFTRLARGETTLARAARHRVVRGALAVLGR